MSVLDLTKTARLYHGGQEIAEAWLAGQRIWAKPVPDPLAAHVSQIPLRLDMSSAANMVVDGDGKVSKVKNKGFAGAAFDLTASGAARPAWDASGYGSINFDGADDFMQFAASQPDLTGVHMVAAIWIPAYTAVGNRPVLEAGGGSIYYTDRSANQLDWRYAFGSETGVKRVTVAHEAWSIAEIRVQGAVISLYWNKVLQLTTTHTNIARLASIVGKFANNTAFFGGRIGGVIATLCETDRSATDLEASTLAVRSHLSAKFGMAP